MKLLSKLLFAIFFVSIVGLMRPSPIFAKGFIGDACSNIGHRFNDWRKNWDNGKDKHKDDDKFCSEHPEDGSCHVSVPEFGVIPGTIALVTSGGTFVFLKKRKN